MPRFYNSVAVAIELKDKEIFCTMKLALKWCIYYENLPYIILEPRVGVWYVAPNSQISRGRHIFASDFMKL
jgi:hypothetical protein